MASCILTFFLLETLEYILLHNIQIYIPFSSASRIIAMLPLINATAIHRVPALIPERYKRSIIPFAAGMENISKAARSDKREIPPSTCFSLTWKLYDIPLPFCPFLEDEEDLLYGKFPFLLLDLLADITVPSLISPG